MTRLVTHGKSEADRLREAEQILSDRINGMPVSQMMEKYSCSRQTIYNRIDAAVAARIAPTVDKHREQMNAAYDEQVERIGRHLAAATVIIEQGTVANDMEMVERGMGHHLKGIEQLNRTREAQRRLNGLDLPTRVDVSVTVQDETERAMAALNEQLGSLVDAPA